jgi:hypothetical protein
MNDQFPGGVKAGFCRLRLPEFQVERLVHLFEPSASFNKVLSHGFSFTAILPHISHIPSIPLLRQNLPILKSDLASQDNLVHPAFDLPPIEGGPAAKVLPKGTQSARIGA